MPRLIPGNPVRSLHSRGFSLLEAVVMMAILAVLAGICVPRYSSAIDRYRLDMATRRVEGDLGLARDQALALSTVVTITFSVDPDPGEYTVPGLDDPLRPGAPYTVRLSDEPYGVTIKSADFGGDAVLSFNGHGLPDGGGQVVLARGMEQSVITVDTAGQDILD